MRLSLLLVLTASAGLSGRAVAGSEQAEGFLGGTGHGLVRVGADGPWAPAGARPGDRSLGAGASLRWSFGRVVSVNGLLQGVFGGDSGAMLELRPELELGPAPWATGPLAVGGAGLSVGGRQASPAAPWVHGAVGVGWHQALVPTGGLRVVARVHLREAPRGELALGWVWGRPPAPAPAPPEPPPEPVAPRVDLSQLPADAEVWIPHPWCYWLPRDEAEEVLPTLPPEVRLRIQARSHDPALATPSTVGGVRLRKATAQGSLLVVGEPGDRVLVGEVDVGTEADGVATLSVRAGVVPLVVVGGGRRAALEVVVEDGQALWVRAPEPGRQAVSFSVGSAELDEGAREQVAALARDRGDWSLAVEGGFSPEGDREANLALARARAAAVRAALVEAGVPAERVVLRPPAVPEGDGLAAARRVAVVVPVPAGEEP